MLKPTTEQLHEAAKDIDCLPMAQAAHLLLQAQTQAAATAEACSRPIAQAASAMATAIRSGGVLRYIAAGSSGLMAAADAMELGGTFSIQPRSIRIHMAGGVPTGVQMPGDTEDDITSLDTDLADVSALDAIIAISASGSTPYTVRGAEIAKKAGATVIGIANNADTPLLDIADHKIVLQTPPEVLSGSTRMGAGTAQKIALNALSTLMALDLGHIHDGMMVNLLADNIKLRGRAVGIVEKIAQVPWETAQKTLQATGGAVKPAILMAAKDWDLAQAETALQKTDGHLRPLLED